jgi:hypothetical protein
MVKQVMFKKYVYEGYAFNISVTLFNTFVDDVYYHLINVLGKDYAETVETTSDGLDESIDKVESNINAFVDDKLNISEEELKLIEDGFSRVSY